MDPLDNFSPFLHGFFFQHLTVDEILTISLVSKAWNQAVGNSREAMKKIWLNVGDRFNEPKKEDLKAFRVSERNYQNFKISEIENGLQILLFPKRHWKRAKIDIQSFTTYKDYINLLNIFNESIVELDIFDMDIERVDNEILYESFPFPHLEILRVGFVTSNCLKAFIQHLPKLYKVQLESITDQGMREDESASELMVKFLKFQTKLTNLSLSADLFVDFIKHNETLKFSLTHLLIEDKGNWGNEERLNFKKFLIEQNQLEWIILCEWTCVESLRAVLAHGNISRVSFDYFDEESKKFNNVPLNLEVNQKIRQIDFDVENCELCWFEPILKACPNVETLYFFHVDEKLLHSLVQNQKFLKRINYCSIFEGFSNKEDCTIKMCETKFLDFKKLF